MTFEGTVIEGQIVLDENPPLQDGTRVKIELQDVSQPQPATSLTTLLRYAGKVTDLPEDMALNHDHYLHGAPKR